MINLLRNINLNSVRNFLNDRRSRTVMMTLSQLLSNDQTIKNGITKKALFNSAIHMGVQYAINAVSIEPCAFHGGDEWQTLPEFSGTMLVMTSEILLSYPRQVLHTMHEHIDIIIITVNDKLKVSWQNDMLASDGSNNFYCMGDINEARGILSRLFWAKYGSESLTFSLERGLGYTLLPDSVTPKKSENATCVVENQKKYLAHGISRAVMLVGRPGTGKTTMAKSIVKQLSLRSLTVDCTAIENLKLNDVIKLVRLLKPDAVILDDYDKLSAQKNLKFLSEIRQITKLVIYTVNDATKFDESIVRPERIDEIVIVERLDKDTVLSILGEEYKDCYELVADWPIMYIKEYMIRCTVLGKEAANKSLKELSKRVNILSNKRSYMDCNDFLIPPETHDEAILEELDLDYEDNDPQEKVIPKVSALTSQRKKKIRKLTDAGKNNRVGVPMSEFMKTKMTGKTVEEIAKMHEKLLGVK